MVDDVSRRAYLEALLASGVAVSTAGCNAGSGGTSPNTATTTSEESPNQAPRITDYSATPRENGNSMGVVLAGEDDRGLEKARIEYGSKAVETTPDDESVRLDDEFTGLEAASLDEYPGQVTYLLRDTDGRETRVEAHPDETAPELQALSVTPTENAGELALTLEGRDDVGLEHVAALLGEDPRLQESVSGQREYSTDQDLDTSEAARFQQNTVTASLEDWNGNTTESEADAYVRKYDVMEDTKMDIGAIYIPWIGNTFGGFLSREEVEPRVGYYEGLSEQQEEVVNQHIDQMQGHGINKVMFSLGESEYDQKFRNFEGSYLSSEVEIEVLLALPTVFNNDVEIGGYLDFVRENILAKPNYNTTGGRPIIQTWGPAYAFYNDRGKVREEIVDEHGGIPEFIDYMREKLSRDGNDPFLVGDAGKRGYYDGYRGFEGAKELWPEWDALSNWVVGARPNETTTEEEAIEFVKGNYQGISRFAESHGQDFYPLVYPGYNDSHNEIWGRDRKISRSPSLFRDLLEIATEYTDDRINVYSFNEWAEGTQIEPGRLLDSEYGTEYLEVVEEFQRAE